MTAAAAPRLVRETFSTSRLAEFCSERELVAQVGHGVADWPLVIGKELLDNALDNAEEVDTAPVISVEVSTESGEITVTDNGDGIAAETVEGLCDYGQRTTSRAAYVAPTRGQQGNALQTVVAMPFVLDGTRGETVIEARGVAHRLIFEVDPIRRVPRIEHKTAVSDVRIGSRVTVRLPPKASHLLHVAEHGFLQLVRNFGWFNPHVALSATWNDVVVYRASATDPNWPKWGPADPISAHWFTPGRLETLIAAQVARDQDIGRSRSVREFIGGTFRGLAGTAKQREVLGETGLSRQTLAAFFADGKIDRTAITLLLAAMQRHSRPVKPADLGIIGADHFKRYLAGAENCLSESLRYHRILGKSGNFPFVLETAFGARPSGSSRSIIAGVNWSPALGNPFRYVGGQQQLGGQSLEDLLGEQRLGRFAPAAIVIHLTIPQATHTDRGKSTIALSLECAESITKAVRRVTRDWCDARKAEERDRQRDRRSAQQQMESRHKAARAEARRDKNAIIGTGVLYQEIAAAAAASGLPITALVVLSSGSDPYLRDTVHGHRDGQWFADQVARFIAPDKKVHLRGLHYLVSSAADVRSPDGSPFVNDYECWKWLQGHASYAARWLGLVPFERIRDERNEPPRVISYAPSPLAGAGYLTAGFGIELPQIGTLMPHLSGTSPVVPQPYRIILIGEKSSLADVLEPIAKEVAGELLLPSGEPSITMIAEMAARAAEDPRPAVVLYFCDFDPSGHQMAHSVARKLQALRTLRHPELKIELHQVALTIDQVRRLGLPSTPLKPTEKRADKWRAHHGHEQTEIDALAALHPGELRRIALEALAPFYDFTLAQRCHAEYQKWESDAAVQLLKHPARVAGEKKIRAAFKGVEKARGTLMRA
jgi:DNA topoisomerase VI subunit B